MRPEVLTAFLRTVRWPCGSEAMLQRELGERLYRYYNPDDGVIRREIRVWPEYRLDQKSRIDFFIEGGIGIEAKVKYPKRQIFRQLERYALCDEITSLILITGTAIGLPQEINGKPLFYVSLGRSAL